MRLHPTLFSIIPKQKKNVNHWSWLPRDKRFVFETYNSTLITSNQGTDIHDLYSHFMNLPKYGAKIHWWKENPSSSNFEINSDCDFWATKILPKRVVGIFPIFFFCFFFSNYFCPSQKCQKLLAGKPILESTCPPLK